MINQKGVTLVELLATLVIFGIFSTIIWAFLFQTVKTNEVEISKNQLQQEANIILNALDEVHRNSSEYTIDYNSDEIIIKPTNLSPIVFSNSQIDYSLIIQINHKELPNASKITVYPSSKQLNISLVLKSKKNENVNTTLKSTFHRLK